MNFLVVLAAKYLVVVPVLSLGIFFLFLARGRKVREGLFALLSLALTYILGVLGGLLYYNPRPFVVGHFVPLIPHAADNGFPSDHTLLAGAVAAVATYWNPKLGAALWILALLIGFARVYAGVHHAVDILGSIICAIVATVSARFLLGRIYRA